MLFFIYYCRRDYRMYILILIYRLFQWFKNYFSLPPSKNILTYDKSTQKYGVTNLFIVYCPMLRIINILF